MVKNNPHRLNWTIIDPVAMERTALFGEYAFCIKFDLSQPDGLFWTLDMWRPKLPVATRRTIYKLQDLQLVIGYAEGLCQEIVDFLEPDHPLDPLVSKVETFLTGDTIRNDEGCIDTLDKASALIAKAVVWLDQRHVHADEPSSIVLGLSLDLVGIKQKIDKASGQLKWATEE